MKITSTPISSLSNITSIPGLNITIEFFFNCTLASSVIFFYLDKFGIIFNFPKMCHHIIFKAKY